MMVCMYTFSKSQGVLIYSDEHSFSAQSLIKRQGAKQNGPPSQSLLKLCISSDAFHLPENAQSIFPYLNNNGHES